jgi:carboxyl-terminal processing protease
MKLTLKQIRRTVLVIIFALLCGGAGYWLGTHKLKVQSEKLKVKRIEFINQTVPEDKEIDFALFWRVWNKLEEKYLIKEDIDEEKMFYGAIQGMTAALGDPYTVFLPPKENKQVKEDLNGSFEGVGIQLGFNKEKRLTVVAPLKGMPAEAAGVKAGDLILHLKDEGKGIDEDTLGMSLPEAVQKIRGEGGTKITLTLLHEGESETFDAEIIRQTIVVPSVEVEFLNAKNAKEEDAKIAHLKLMRFGELTAQQWDDSIAKIKDKNLKIKGVILDVRGNPGGYLKGSVNLASEFLEKGVIVKQENYLGQIETYSVNRRGRLLDIPLLVLIDKGSASASEIVAGALRDHDRAELLGETSFGKGTIQESEEVNGESALHITTAKWLTPNGDWVNEIGLKPDYEVEDNLETEDKDEQVEKAVEILLKVD